MEPHDPKGIRSGALVLALVRRGGERCAQCDAVLCAHELLVAIMMGVRDEPLCPACLAGPQGRDAESFVRDVAAHARRRDCFGAAWAWASANEPWCRFSALDRDASSFQPEVFESRGMVLPDDEWDAGDMACGDLVLELRNRLRSMRAGGVLLVTAEDLGASEDLPAWCRMTGHRLVYARAPLYAIRNKEE